MQSIADLVADAREHEGVLFQSVERSTPFSYHDFCTNAWKVGNLLRHYGVREGARVAVVAGPKAPTADDEPGRIGESPDALQAFLGAALDGAVVDLDPPGAVETKVMIAPNDWLDDYQLGPGTKPIAYGGPPDDPRVAHLEREAWSENPLQPPGEFGPADPVLAADELYTHGDLLAASERVVAENDLREDDTVALRAPVTDAGTVVAGLLAPMRVGATVLLGEGETGTVAVSDGSDVPEERVVRPGDASP
jgi:hypothetical protein